MIVNKLDLTMIDIITFLQNINKKKTKYSRSNHEKQKKCKDEVHREI